MKLIQVPQEAPKEESETTQKLKQAPKSLAVAMLASNSEIKVALSKRNAGSIEDQISKKKEDNFTANLRKVAPPTQTPTSPKEPSLPPRLNKIPLSPSKPSSIVTTLPPPSDEDAPPIPQRPGNSKPLPNISSITTLPPPLTLPTLPPPSDEDVPPLPQRRPLNTPSNIKKE